jgi:hypothetical protein
MIKSDNEKRVRYIRGILGHTMAHSTRLKCNLHTSAKPQGSQLVEGPVMGMGSGPSPPTNPAANSFNEVTEVA